MKTDISIQCSFILQVFKADLNGCPCKTIVLLTRDSVTGILHCLSIPVRYYFALFLALGYTFNFIVIRLYY